MLQGRVVRTGSKLDHRRWNGELRLGRVVNVHMQSSSQILFCQEVMRGKGARIHGPGISVVRDLQGKIDDVTSECVAGGPGKVQFRRETAPGLPQCR